MIMPSFFMLKIKINKEKFNEYFFEPPSVYYNENPAKEILLFCVTKYLELMSMKIIILFVIFLYML